jgi:hypothetical protein
LFTVSSSCHTVMPVDINLKYDGQQQEWLWWKIYSKKYWLGYLWLPQSQNMISLYLSCSTFLILRFEHFWMAKPISQLAELLYWNTTRSSWLRSINKNDCSFAYCQVASYWALCHLTLELSTLTPYCW